LKQSFEAWPSVGTHSNNGDCYPSRSSPFNLGTLRMMVEGVWDATKRKELIDELSRHQQPAPSDDPVVVNRRKDLGQPTALPQ
jgi:hypothetical protein